MTTSIILEVCRELEIEPSDFFGNKRNFGSKRNRHVTIARHMAIERLKEAGFSNAGIARLTRLSYSTVQYWLHPEYRDQRVDYFRQLHASRKEAGAQV